MISCTLPFEQHFIQFPKSEELPALAIFSLLLLSSGLKRLLCSDKEWGGGRE